MVSHLGQKKHGHAPPRPTSVTESDDGLIPQDYLLATRSTFECSNEGLPRNKGEGMGAISREMPKSASVVVVDVE